MPEREIRLVDGSTLNFDKLFLQPNVKKKIYSKSSSQFDFMLNAGHC